MVCAPAGTHFEAAHFHLTASRVRVAEVLSRWYKSILHSVCHFRSVAFRMPFSRFACPWARTSRHFILASLYIIFMSFCILYASPRFARPWARISRHLIFYPSASHVSVAEALSCWYKSILHSVCHFRIIAFRMPFSQFACPRARTLRHLILASSHIISMSF